MTRTIRSRVRQLAGQMVLLPVYAYRLARPMLGPRRCRYYPSCSAYAVGAVRDFGVLRGVLLAGWRLLRCNPWSAGGVDFPDAQRLFPLGRGRVSRETQTQG